MILAVANFCIIVIELSRILYFPTQLQGWCFYILLCYSQSSAHLMVHINKFLLHVCLITCLPLTCCPGPRGCQVLSFCASMHPGKEMQGQAIHIGHNHPKYHKNNETYPYLLKTRKKTFKHTQAHKHYKLPILPQIILTSSKTKRNQHFFMILNIYELLASSL